MRSVDVTKGLTGATEGYDGGTFAIMLNCGTDGTFPTSVTAGGTEPIDGIPLGATCTVTESADRPALADGSYAWGDVTIAPETVTITEAGQVIDVQVTNQIDRVYGAVAVSKTLIAPDGVVDPARSYGGTWTCQYGTDAPVTGEWSTAAGETAAVLSDQILVGSECTATENTLDAPSGDPSYRWLEPVIVDATVDGAGGTAVVAVTNEVIRDMSTVTVSKSLTGAIEGFTGGTDDVFQVNYECTTPGVTGSYTGSVTVGADADPVSLFANQLAGVPDGWTCTVTETAPTGNLADGSYAWGEPTITPATFVVGETADLNVTVENTIERVYAPVTLVKIINDPDLVVDPARVYTGSWTCQYGTDTPVTGQWENTISGGAITLSEDILVGSECTATEDELTAPAMNGDPSYTWGTPVIEDAQVTAGGGQISVTNPVVRGLGAFTITKEVTGATEGYTGADGEHFTVTYLCASGEFQMRDTVTIANGGSVTIPDVPLGWTCALGESAPSADLLVDGSYAWGLPVYEPGNVTLTADEPDAVLAISNPIVRVYADVLVDKNLVAPAGIVDAARTFTGTVTCTYGEDEPLKGTWTLAATDPAAAVDFGGERPLVGSGCTVTEDDPGAPTPADPSYVFADPETTEITSLEISGGTLTVTNTVERQLGSIAITKNVVGETAGFTGGEEDVFTISYTCANPAGGAPVTGTAAIGQGFPPAVISDLPVGWACSIAEDAPSSDLLVDGSYQWAAPAISPETATVALTVAPEFIVTNTVERSLEMVDMAKTVTSSEQLEDGTWKVTYRIVVSNPLDQESIYSLTDTLDYGEGITPTSAQWREEGGEWNAWADPSAPAQLATDRVIARGGADDYADHVYEIEVISTVAVGVIGTTPGTCTVTGEGTSGGFLNHASITVGEETEEEIACEEPTIPGIAKTFTSASQNADGTWTVLYGLTVDNSNGNAGYYSLADTHGFPAEVTVHSWTVTDGEGETVVEGPYTDGAIAANLPIAAGATHTYVVAFVVSVPVTIDDGLLECGSNGSSEGRGFYNRVELTSGEDTVVDDDCGPIAEGGVPSITKTMVGAEQQADDSWIVTYEVRVAANADYVTTYSLTDTIAFAPVVEVTSASWTGPTSGTWDLTAGYTATLATDRVLAAGAEDEVYTVAVTATVPADAIGTPNLDCTLQPGEAGTGFLNTAELTSGGWTGDAEDCTVPVLPFVQKDSVGLDKNMADGEWDGTWNATYQLTVTNPGTDGQEVTYSLTDLPVFPDGVEIVSQSATSDAAGLPDGWSEAFDGGGSAVITDRTTGAESEVYTLVFNLRVGADIAPEARECVPNGLTTSGLMNVGTISTGGTSENDDACIDIPSPGIEIDKTVVSSARNADGTWSVVYEVTAANTGDLPVTYSLTDTLQFGNGITPTSAGWVQVGTLRTGTWADPAADAAATLAEGRELAPLATETYRVTVTATVGASVVGTPAGTCEAGSEEPGGFLNTVQMSAGDLADDAQACAEPTAAPTPPTPPAPPAPPAKPMPPTGVGEAGSALALAGTLAGAGLLLMVMRRRRLA